ncbi:MAG: REP-associated tyrosine transposase [Cellvibrionaceae bacterium]
MHNAKPRKAELGYPENSFFFTMTTHGRRPIFNTPENVTFLRQAFHHTMNIKPFVLTAISILPDHLHCIWEIPNNEHEAPNERWKLITTLFKQQQPNIKQLWQEPNFAHKIIDRIDYANHVDYIELNPIKQGYVDTAKSWPYTRFTF